jgi:hypothetical protein
MQNLYRSFAQKHDLPLHLQPQWLDAISGDAGWGACVVTDGSGDLMGLMPYFVESKLGFKMITMPTGNQYSGPFFFYPPQELFKEVTKAAFEKRVISEIVAQLPKTISTKIVLRPEIKNNLPWHWLGYKEKVQYTYRMPIGSDMSQVRANYKRSVRTDLNKARQQSSVKVLNDPQLLYDFAMSVFRKKGVPIPYPHNHVHRIMERLEPMGQAKILVATDLATDEPYSAMLVANDNHQNHLILNGQSNNAKGACSIYLLFDHMIELSMQEGRILDLEGSMDATIEHFLRSFGGQLTPYSVITKESRLIQMMKAVAGR